MVDICIIDVVYLNVNDQNILMTALLKFNIINSAILNKLNIHSILIQHYCEFVIIDSISSCG